MPHAVAVVAVVVVVMDVALLLSRVTDFSSHWADTEQKNAPTLDGTAIKTRS